MNKITKKRTFYILIWKYLRYERIYIPVRQTIPT